MSLSANVEALLEVYSKCLGLLHVFGDSNKLDKSKTSPSPSATAVRSRRPPDTLSECDRQSQLSRSLHSDRAKVVQAFSSRLSESGTRLAKGDARSCSALRRILNRLTKVLSGIFSTGSNGTYSGRSDSQPLLNYDALRALSKSSRVGAIHAIDDLSVRLKYSSDSRTGSRAGSKTGSKSGHSVASTRSAKSGRSVKSGRSAKSARLSKASPSSAAAVVRASARAPPTTVSSAPMGKTLKTSLETSKTKTVRTEEQHSRQLALAVAAPNSGAAKKTSSSHAAGKSKASPKQPVASSKAGSSASAGRSKKQKKRQDAAANAGKPIVKEPSKKAFSEAEAPVSQAPQAAGHGPRYAQASTQTSNRDGIDRFDSIVSSGTFTSGSTTSTARAGPLRTGLHTGSDFKSNTLPKNSARPISMLSSSSASTRLGEIPEHKLRRRHMAPEPLDGVVGAQESFEYYSISVAYPMRPLWIPEDQAGAKGTKKEKQKQKEKEKQKEEKGPEEKKKHFWGRGRA